MTIARAVARARAAKVNALAPDLAAAACGADHMTVRFDALLGVLEGREAAIRVAVALESELAGGVSTSNAEYVPRLALLQCGWRLPPDDCDDEDDTGGMHRHDGGRGHVGDDLCEKVYILREDI